MNSITSTLCSFASFTSKLAKLHKVEVMEFKPSESCCQSNYRYLHQRLLSIQASMQALFSATVFSERLSFFNICWVSRAPRQLIFGYLGLQIAGKSISNIFFDFKPHIVHHWQTPFPPCEYYGLLIKSTKSYHPNGCIKMFTTNPQGYLIGRSN